MSDLATENYPKVSIVIVNLNGRKWMERCLNSVLDCDYPPQNIELILVDNGSSDGTVEYVKRNWSDQRLRILENRNNVGWSPANNQGMRLAGGEIIVGLSNDMEVSPTWLKEIVRTMFSESKIGIVQFNSMSLWDRNTPDSGMNFLDKYGFAYSYAPRTSSEEVFFAEGMAFAIRRDVFREIGGFDNYYFMEYDDMDLSWRARLAGYKVYFSPSALVYHARGGTVGATYFTRNLNNITFYVRNHFVTLIKNYELTNLLPILPKVFLMQVVKMIYFAKTRNARLLFATVKGMSSVLRDAKLILQKRREVQSITRKVSDDVIIKQMHPFRPDSLKLFFALQARGQRAILDGSSPRKKIV